MPLLWLYWWVNDNMSICVCFPPFSLSKTVKRQRFVGPFSINKDHAMVQIAPLILVIAIKQRRLQKWYGSRPPNVPLPPGLWPPWKAAPPAKALRHTAALLWAPASQPPPLFSPGIFTASRLSWMSTRYATASHEYSGLHVRFVCRDGHLIAKCRTTVSRGRSFCFFGCLSTARIKDLSCSQSCWGQIPGFTYVYHVCASFIKQITVTFLYKKGARLHNVLYLQLDTTL